MASVHKQPGTRYLIAHFRDSNGKHRCRTTRETNRRKAQQIADVYERAVKSKGNLARVRQIFSELCREHYREEVPAVTVRTYCEQWLAARKAETAPGTYKIYSQKIASFLKFLSSDAERSIEDITSSQITDFRNHQASKLSSGTVNLMLQVIRSLFHAARREGYIFVDPTETVKGVKNHPIPERERRPFSQDELNTIIAAANPEWQSMIRFGFYTGLRLGDIATLTWKQVDLANNVLRVLPRKTERTGKVLLIQIAPTLRKHLLSMHNGDGINPQGPVHPQACALYTPRDNESGPNAVLLSNEFTKILFATGLRTYGAGFKQGKCLTGLDLSFHGLRHTAISMLAEAGIARATVQAMVGHESKEMNQHYTHIGTKALAEAANSMPEI